MSAALPFPPSFDRTEKFSREIDSLRVLQIGLLSQFGTQRKTSPLLTAPRQCNTSEAFAKVFADIGKIKGLFDTIKTINIADTRESRMNYISVSDAARAWGVSERSVRNYCAQGRVEGAFLTGKTWNIPEGAQKPKRRNGREEPLSPLLSRLREEKASALRGGIYHKVQVELTYNSNHIEGSRLSLDQTRLIFETATIGANDEPIRVDDIVETANHFRAIDYVIENAEAPLSEALVKELHRILKASTTDASRDWFAVGEYKRLPNEVAGKRTTAPKDVAAEMATLLRAYQPKVPHDLQAIIDYHVKFERIHPFQDGNGRVGRLIMFKECLANGLVPFIVSDDMKAFYYRGLLEWDEERGFLLDTCLTAQDRFKSALDYFRIPYDG